METWCLIPFVLLHVALPVSLGKLSLICLQSAETQATGLAAGTEEICDVNSSLSCEMNKLCVEKEIQVKSTFPVLIKLPPPLFFFVVYFQTLLLEWLTSVFFQNWTIGQN